MEFLNQIDWAAVFKIIGIDIMLGVDNAVVIALACASLPLAMRPKAILWGTAGAVGLRVILLIMASLLLAFCDSWGIPIKMIAGAYLLYIGYSLLMSSDSEEHIQSSDHMWGAVKVIIIADFMMSLDNVLAVTAASQSAGAHATAYAIAGILFSIPIIVFGATGIMKLMDKFPIIIWVGAGLLGWVGAEMIISDALLTGYMTKVHMSLGEYTHLSYKIAGFAAVVFAVLGVNAWSKRKVEVQPA